MCYKSIYYTGEEYDEQMTSAIGDNYDDVSEEDLKSIDPDYYQSFRTYYGGFTRETIETLFNGTGRTQDGDSRLKYKCDKCKDYFPRKKDKKREEAYITIDHKKSVKQHWNSEGKKMMKDKVKLNKWYNDINNLRLLCCSCNSKKGG